MKKRVYLLLELKRICKAAVQMFAGAIVLAGIVGTFAFFAQKLLYNDSLMDKIRVGIVLEDSQNSKILTTAMKFLESMDSVKDTCEFIYMEQGDAREALDRGELSAVMVVPATLVGDIMDGTNTPVQVIFSNENTLTGAMLMSLTKAGARTLSCAQAGIYTVYDVYTQYGLEREVQSAFDTLNAAYLRFALARSRAFEHETVSVTGKLDASYYYGVMAVVFFVMLSGMGLGGALRREKRAVAQKLDIAGLSGWKCVGIRFLAVGLMYFALIMLLTLALLMWWSPVAGLSAKSVAGAIAIAVAGGACFSALFILLYELAPTAGSGVLLVFMAACASMLISGGIIPSGFMPPGLAVIGQKLPAGLLMGLLWGLLDGALLGQALGLLTAFTAVFLGMAMGVRMLGGQNLGGHMNDRRNRGRCMHGGRNLGGYETAVPGSLKSELGDNKANGTFSGIHYGIWFLMIFKRLFKHPSFIGILLVFPALCAIVGSLDKNNEQPVRIALYVEESEDGLNTSVTERLLSDDGILDFYVCQSEEELRSDVAALKAECGYVLPKDISKRMHFGENKGLVRTIVSPATVSARLVDEVVFSYIFQDFAPEILLDHLTSALPVNAPVDKAAVLSRLDDYMRDGSTFRFEFNRDMKNTYTSGSFMNQYMGGLLAVYIFICGLLGSYDSIKDRKRGVYVRLGYPGSTMVPLILPFAAALCAGAAAWLGLGFLGEFSGVRELVRLLAYVVFVTGYCGSFAGIFRREITFCMIIPVLTLGSLLSVMVPSDALTVIKGFGWFTRLFPPGWYVDGLAGNMWITLAAGAVLCGLSVILRSFWGADGRNE